MTVRLLDPSTVADLLSMKRSAVIALARGNGIPAVKIGRQWRFEEAALDAWIAERTAYTAVDGEAEAPRERGRDNVQGARPPKAVGGKRHGRVDSRGPADQTGALRIVRAGG